MGDSFWVPGIPATFATSGEIPWRHRVAEDAPDWPGAEATGLQLEFRIQSRREGFHAQDIDNLCEPVIAALVSERGWFEGHRKNISWIHARKDFIAPTGCLISTESADREDVPAAGIVLDSIYAGALPRSAKDDDLIAWVASQVARPVQGRLRVELNFLRNVNIADIATGRVKNVIDCLVPVVGGKYGSPDDWRIDELLVTRRVEPGRGTFLVRVAALG